MKSSDSAIYSKWYSKWCLRSTGAIGNVGTELARVAQSECEQLLNGAEAKAYYGLARNYKSLQALVGMLEEKEVITGQQLIEVGTP